MADGATVDGATNARAALALQVADEVRAIIAELSTRDVAEADLREALGLAQAMRAHLDGPKSVRWYDAPDLDTIDDASKDSFHAQSPFRGRANALAPPLDVEQAERDDGTTVIRAVATLGPAYEGPPHGVHGGFVAALFDEVLGATQGLTEGPGVTGRLTVHFRHLTPLGEQLRFEGWIEKEEGRRLVAKATCHAEDGTLCAEADGLFFKVDFQALQQMMEERRA
jgi:acyl-coenzyme A thioesterase PaaI-like protein